MKIVAIFRGFPGLGRVVSGVEIIKQIHSQYNAQVKIFTYLQGYEYTKMIFPSTENIIAENDISSIGIIPVSSSGEKIIDEIELFYPNFVLIDGEPLLLQTIKLRFPNLKIVCGDAGKAEKLHAETGLGEVKYIISGLPFASLPGEISENILSEVDKFMAKSCLFRTFQYVHGYYFPPALRFRQRMEEKYGKVERSKVILKNVPPAYTLTWKTFI